LLRSHGSSKLSFETHAGAIEAQAGAMEAQAGAMEASFAEP